MFCVAVNENNEAEFERGCTIKDVCNNQSAEGLEFCSTCTFPFCNFNRIDSSYIFDNFDYISDETDVTN